MAPASIDDSKIRLLIKEHRNNKEKINDAISGWWESAESKANVVEVEEWVTTTKAKKAIPSGNANHSENHGSSDRNSGGGRGAGRGGARAAPAGGRGAGRDTGRGINTASGRSTSPRVEGDELIVSSVTSKTETTTSESAAPVAAKGAGKGNNAWGQKKTAKVEASASQAASESKAAPEPVRALPAPNLPADSLWNSVETAAQRIKRLEREKNQPPPAPPVVEETPAPVDGAEKIPKKKKERVKKADKKDKAPVSSVADDVVIGDETAPLQNASSLLGNLTIDAPAAPVESPPSPAKVKSSTPVDVEGSPKIGLKMGKWENKSERIDGPSLSFGSFGNATSLVAEESSATSASWGAAASDSSTSDVPVSGAAVWSNGQQNDTSNNGSSGNQNGPPGLGNGKTQRSAPGQSRNKNDNQQSAQQTQAAYQQPPGFGAPGSRGSPVANMTMPYGQPFEYMHPQFQAAPAAPVPAAGGAPGAPAAATGAATAAATGSVNMLNPAAPQQPQQGYAQPPGMAAPQFYNQNPYYGYQGMQPYYYGQAPVQQNYYGQHQPRGYQNGRGPNHGYADPYNANGYTSVDAFGGQFGNAGQNANQGNKSGKDASPQEQSTAQQPQQQQQQQQYPQYMGGAPYQANPAAGWGGYNQQTAMYGMYPNANPSVPQQGGRENNRGYGNNYNNNNSNSNNRSSSNEANAQTGYSSWGSR